MADDDKSALEYVSEVHDLMELADFVDDEAFTEALDYIVRLTLNPHVKQATAAYLAVRMQAYSAKFKMQATSIMVLHNTKAGTHENKMKNTYFSMSEVCDKLAQALKYIAREL